MNIIAKTYKWAHPLTRRAGKPTYVNWHHAAAKTLTPDGLHKIHLGLGWCGFAYNLYIRKSGKVYRGRPLQFCGGGAIGHWADIGVCLEGNYDVEDEMPAKQLRAAQEVKDWLDDRYPGVGHRGHKQVPGNQTACPGRHFPVKAIMAGVPEEEPKAAKVKLTKRSITIRRRFKPHRPGWYNLGVVGFYKRCKRQGDGKRWKIRADEVTLPEPAVKGWWWEEAEKAAAELSAAKAAPPVTPAVRLPRKRPPFWWVRRKP